MSDALHDIMHRCTGADRLLIERAYALAEQTHQAQLRADGSPYITHPLAVAQYLVDLGFDAASVAAALLHDVVEDSTVTRAELAHQFGDEVAFLVSGVTKLKTIQLRGATRDAALAGQTNLQTESLKKMFFAMADDVRVIIIKLADRLHNMRTLQYKDAPTRVRKALETMEIYAPIADRLGMGRLKGELEDLSFPYAYPTEHAWLKKAVKGKYEDRLRYIERAAPVVKRTLLDAGVRVLDIHARAKRMWSLYRKLKRYDMDPDKVMDLVALRVIVPEVKDCYEALGVIHGHYTPMPGRIKDYVALPKPNGYRSLHTTVFCEKGRIAEIQIRTPDMHDHAENGVAAHWSYSEAGKRAVTAKQKELAWINQLKQVLKGIKTAAGMADLKIDFFKDRIFVLTPQGDVKDLPEGATPVDFAYAVHSELGHRTTGALTNGRIITIDAALQSGAVVEIIKGKEARPRKDWLRFVKTTQAAKHIRAWLRSHESSIPETPAVESRIAKRRTRVVRPLTTPRSTTPLAQLTIAGHTDLAYKLGRCCSPTPDEHVVGYLTRTRGVTVHRHDCTNVKTAPTERLLDVSWSAQD